MKRKYLNTTGVILAGGSSLRMKVNKAMLEIEGKTAIQIIFEKLETTFEKILISSNEPTLYGFLNAQIIPDIIPNHGPLSGVHAGLTAASTKNVFFIPCDLPLMSTEMIRYFIELNSNAGIILPLIQCIPRYDFGIYERSLLTEIEKQVKEDSNPSLRKLIKTEKTKFIEVEKLPFFHEDLFLNMNLPTDYERVKLLFKKYESS